jgi:hypothetical protein
MIQGEIDTDAPKYHSVRLYEKLLPAYHVHPDRLKLSIYDGIPHRVTSDMEEETADWFIRFLG